MSNTSSPPRFTHHLVDVTRRDDVGGVDVELHPVRVRVLDHHLSRPDRACVKRRREGLHDHLAEIDGLRVGILGLHRPAASGGRDEFARHMQHAVLGLEHRPHIGEIVDAHAGGEAALAACACGGTEVKRRHFRIGVLVDEDGQRFEVLCHPWRHAHGQRHQRRVFGRPRNFQHDHAVFGLDGAIAESLLLERGPDILVGLARPGRAGAGSPARQRRRRSPDASGGGAWQPSS